MSCYGKIILTVVKIARQTLFRTVLKGVRTAIGKRGESQLPTKQGHWCTNRKLSAEQTRLRYHRILAIQLSRVLTRGISEAFHIKIQEWGTQWAFRVETCLLSQFNGNFSPIQLSRPGKNVAMVKASLRRGLERILLNSVNERVIASLHKTLYMTVSCKFPHNH